METRENWTAVDTTEECELPHPHGGLHKRMAYSHPSYQAQQTNHQQQVICDGTDKLGHREF